MQVMCMDLGLPPHTKTASVNGSNPAAQRAEPKGRREDESISLKNTQGWPAPTPPRSDIGGPVSLATPPSRLGSADGAAEIE